MRRSKLSNRGALKRIAQALNAQIWSPDTLDLIAQIMRQAGYPIADPPDVETSTTNPVPEDV